MKTVSVRDLRNSFSKLEAWLAEGEQIQIQKRDEPIAMLTALPAARTGKKIKMPDFEARRKALWGDRVFSEKEVAQMRADELEGERG